MNSRGSPTSPTPANYKPRTKTVNQRSRQYTSRKPGEKESEKETLRYLSSCEGEGLNEVGVKNRETIKNNSNHEKKMEAKLSLIQGMISSKFGSEDCAKRIGSAGIVIRAADHARERPRRNKAASAQQFDRHRIGLQAVYDESLAE